MDSIALVVYMVRPLVLDLLTQTILQTCSLRYVRDPEFVCLTVGVTSCSIRPC